MYKSSSTFDAGNPINAWHFGYNGQEKDNEIYGEGNSTTAEFWQYDTRLGRRWDIDPMTPMYAWQSPYACFNNNPILFADPLGLEGSPPKNNWWGGDKQVKKDVNRLRRTNDAFNTKFKIWRNLGKVFKRSDSEDAPYLEDAKSTKLPGSEKGYIIYNGVSKNDEVWAVTFKITYESSAEGPVSVNGGSAPDNYKNSFSYEHTIPKEFKPKWNKQPSATNESGGGYERYYNFDIILSKRSENRPMNYGPYGMEPQGATDHTTYSINITTTVTTDKVYVRIIRNSRGMMKGFEFINYKSGHKVTNEGATWDWKDRYNNK